MTLSPAQIETLAKRLLDAHDRATAIPQISNDHPDMSVADAYAVQAALAQNWIARGARITGYKAGLTSQVKMKQIGIDVPSFGVLTSEMAVPENSEISISEMIHPRVEAEIGFVTKHALGGSELNIDDVIAATDFIIPAIEVIDSRYKDFKFDLPSVIADNSSSGRYITGGRPQDAATVDLRTIGVVVEHNGAIAAVGASAAVLNHPARAVCLLVRHLAELGRTLPAGSFVMTGSIIEAIPVSKGDVVSARFQGLGSITVNFT